MTREFAFQVVNVTADFSAFGTQRADDVRFSHLILSAKKPHQFFADGMA